MALVGAEAARAWGQPAFEAQARALARNARWWARMKALGVAFDANRFAEPAHLHHVVVARRVAQRRQYRYYRCGRLRGHALLEDLAHHQRAPPAL